MSAVAAPADRRFRRAHVKPARRRRNWTARLMPLGMYGLFGVLIVYALAILFLNVFDREEWGRLRKVIPRPFRSALA